MFKKASVSVRTFLLWYLLTHCHLLHQLVQLERLQKTQKRTLMTLNQKMTEVSKSNIPLISYTVQVQHRSAMVPSDNLKCLIIWHLTGPKCARLMEFYRNYEKQTILSARECLKMALGGRAVVIELFILFLYEPMVPYTLRWPFPEMDKFGIKKVKWLILLTSNISSGNTAFVALS